MCEIQLLKNQKVLKIGEGKTALVRKEKEQRMSRGLSRRGASGGIEWAPAQCDRREKS